MGHLRGRNLYPDTDAPELEVGGIRQHGGEVSPVSLVGLDNPDGVGTIWYTTDGSDPRLTGGAVNNASASAFSAIP